ncbi:MAG TPA: MraY family glycosyltransferase [Blastocatellia bacterium]|nr:MraY family glycosyltransferase [Blastocatellia bacterium]
MRSYLTLFFVSLVLTLLFTPQARRLATALGAVDVPDNERRVHKRPTPRMGGVAIYVAFLLTLLCVPLLRSGVSQTFTDGLIWYGAIVAPATLIFWLGVYDDLRGAKPWVKVVIQVVAAAMLHAFGFGISVLALPFGSEWFLPYWMSFPLTALWVVGITNAFNLIDGIDGLATGASAFALISILFFSLTMDNTAVSLTSAILIGSVLGFLYFNFHPASIFLGDSGSLFLGFMVAALSLAGSQKSTTAIAIAIPLVSFGLPILDVGLALTRRFIKGQPLLQSDRGHIHHRLLDHGLSQRQTAILLYGVCGAFTLFGILLLNPERSLSALVFSVIGVLVVLGVQRLRYPEFEELGSAIRRRVATHRRSLAVNVGVRNLHVDLQRVTTPERLFALLVEIAIATEFEGIRLELRSALPTGRKYQFWKKAELVGWRLPIGTTLDEEDGLTLMYERNGRFVEDMTTGDDYWRLTLPLSMEGQSFGAITLYRHVLEADVAVDLRNLCSSFQRELSLKINSFLSEAEANSLAFEVQQ